MEYLDGQSLWQIERRFISAITSMESIGVLVDQELARSEIAMGTKIMADIVKDLDGLKPTSPTDLQELLINRLGLPLVKPTNGTKDLPRDQWKPSFDKYAMEDYELILNARNDNTAQKILEYRGWQKAISTYFVAFIEKACHDGRIRPNFKVHGTRTSRLSCEKPNFQQIPRTTDEAKRWNLYTKKCIIPTPGWKLWEFDYSNLELRLAAVYAQQQNLMDAFNSGQNIWQYMMAELGWTNKSRVKTHTYRTLYGAGVRKTALAEGLDNNGARKLINDFYRPWPRVKHTLRQINDGAKEQGYIKYWTGRRRHFPASESSHKAANSLFQGGGAEVVKRALIEVYETVCDEYCRLVLTVHDSIALEIKEGYEDIYKPKVKAIMERIPTRFFDMKFTVDCHIWGEG